MAPDATLLLIERVVPAGNTASSNKWMDLNMLIASTGRERTEAEFRSLLAAPGFELARVVSPMASVSLIEGAPVLDV